MTQEQLLVNRTASVSGGGGSRSGTDAVGEEGTDGGRGGIASASAAATAAAAA